VGKRGEGFPRTSPGGEERRRVERKSDEDHISKKNGSTGAFSWGEKSTSGNSDTGYSWTKANSKFLTERPDSAIGGRTRRDLAFRKEN